MGRSKKWAIGILLIPQKRQKLPYTLTLDSVLDYLKDVGIATLWQTFVLFGPLSILSLLMHFVAQWNETLSYKVMGKNVFLYGFGWLGTAIHELGHALFALIFFHKITDIKLFDAKGKGGSMGYVEHSYNKRNIYQNIGNIFIGIGPVLMGALMLFLITYLLFGISLNSYTGFNSSLQSFTSVNGFFDFTKDAYLSIVNFMKIVLFSTQSNWWKITLLVYCLYAIGSSITLSPSDIKGAWQGFAFFLLVLIVFNLATLWMGNFTEKAFASISSYGSGLYFLITLSILVNLVFVLMLWVISLVKK
jgi:hypothetical protein